MCSITNEQQARTVPAQQAARLNRENRNLFPILHLIDPISQLWPGLSNGLSELLQASRAYLLIVTFRNHIAHLPVISTIEMSHHYTWQNTAKRLINITRFPAQAKPEHIHRRRSLNRLKPS